MYAEALELIVQGLTKPVLDFHGKYYSFRQRADGDQAAAAAASADLVWRPRARQRRARGPRNLHIVSLDPPAETRLSIERYRATWRPAHPGAPMPKLGLGRFVVVAHDDAEALRLARRAYPVWHRAFTHLFRLYGRPQGHPRPADFDTLMARGQGIAGSPATVTNFLTRQLAETQCNYVVGQFAFGDLTREECLRSIALFASDVMPGLRAKAGADKTLSLAK